MARNFPFTIRQIAEILKLKICYENPNNGNVDTDCPFCKKECKLNLNAAKNVYRCNDCHFYGGMIELYARFHGITNSNAYHEICEILKCKQTKPVASESPASQPIIRANSDVIHQTYSMLLSLLTLSNPHNEQLLAKGLLQINIDSFNYKSVPAFGQHGLCIKLVECGCTLEGVPGFFREGGKWNVKLKAPGIIIPVCGIDGKISGLQIRLNKPINERKYIWLSSPNMEGGASSGSPIHFIGDPTAKRVYVTDGLLKGTVAHILSRFTFMCLPGAKSLCGLDDLLKSLKTNGTVEFVEAFDINKLTDNKANETAATLRKKLLSYGFNVSSAVWENKTLIRIDDYFKHRMITKKNHVYSVDGITESAA